MSGARPPARGRGGRREDLIAAASRVVDAHGVAGTTTRRIATEAAVPLGTVHYWFSSKDELLEALAVEHISRIGQAAADAGQSSTAGATAAAEAALRGAVASESGFTTSQQLTLYELTTWALRTPGRAGLAARIYGAIREATEHASSPWLEQYGAHLDTDPQTLAGLLGALYDGLGLARLADPEGTDVEAVIVLMARLLGSGADPAAGASPPPRPPRPDRPDDR